MATRLEERIAKSKAHTAKLEQLRRAEQRKEREAEKKKNQRRNYIVGELVSKYFPEIMTMEPGTKAENMVRFEPLERILLALSTNTQLREQLKENAVRFALKDDENGSRLSPDCPGRVSGPVEKTGSAYARKGGDGCG